MNWLKKLWRWAFGPRRDLVLRITDGDTPPDLIEKGELVVAREDGEDWAAAFICPCGCGERVDLALIEEVRPHWRLTVNSKHHPNLHPSVWRKTGCRSHFWVRDGRIVWCKE